MSQGMPHPARVMPYDDLVADLRHAARRLVRIADGRTEG